MSGQPGTGRDRPLDPELPDDAPELVDDPLEPVEPTVPLDVEAELEPLEDATLLDPLDPLDDVEALAELDPLDDAEALTEFEPLTWDEDVDDEPDAPLLDGGPPVDPPLAGVVPHPATSARVRPRMEHGDRAERMGDILGCWNSSRELHRICGVVFTSVEMMKSANSETAAEYACAVALAIDVRFHLPELVILTSPDHA